MKRSIDYLMNRKKDETPEKKPKFNPDLEKYYVVESNQSKAAQNVIVQ
jgi:hypothetical protein